MTSTKTKIKNDYITYFHKSFILVYVSSPPPTHTHTHTLYFRQTDIERTCILSWDEARIPINACITGPPVTQFFTSTLINSFVITPILTDMDMQYKEGINGEVGIRPVGKGKVKRSDLFVRFLALVLTLAAAVVLGANNQSTTVSVKIVPSLPPVNLPVTAKWLYMSAFVYVFIHFLLAFMFMVYAGKVKRL